MHYVGTSTIHGIYEEFQLRKLLSFLHKQETEEIASLEIKEDMSPTFGNSAHKYNRGRAKGKQSLSHRTSRVSPTGQLEEACDGQNVVVRIYYHTHAVN